MKQFSFIFIGYTIIIFFIVSHFSCGAKCNPNYTVDQTTLEKFHELSQKQEKISTDSRSNNIEVYLDFSDGIHTAIMSCNRIFDEVLNMVQNEDTRYLVCGRSDSLKLLTRTELDSQYNPKDAHSFIEPLSILDKPLDRIIKENKFAIYVTDFELTFRTPKMVNVPNGNVLTSIDLSLDWATTYFDKWLSASNSIDVFAKPFTKKRGKGVQSQFLYFIIFTPKGYDDNRIVESLHKLNDTEKDVQYFSFSKSRFQISTNYDKQEQQGLNENIASRGDILKGKGFEYYRVKFEDFGRLDKTENKNILHNIFFNQQLEGFINMSYHIQVEDITTKYKLLVDSTYCSSGSGTNLEKLDLNGALKPEHFELESKASTNNQTEFCIKKHESFTGIDPSQERQIFKISIRFKNATYQPDVAKMEQVLQWRDINLNQLVPGLYGGLKQAASRMEIKDVPIYTYYLEIIP